MTSNGNPETSSCGTIEALSSESIDKAVKALISLASSATEADEIVREFNPELDGEDTIPLLKNKYDYVSKLFGVNQEARAACNPQTATEFGIAATNYYSLLSILTLRRLG